MDKTKPSLNSDRNTNDLSFEDAMGIIAKVPKSVVDKKMAEFKNAKNGNTYVDIQEPHDGGKKLNKKAPK